MASLGSRMRSPCQCRTSALGSRPWSSGSSLGLTSQWMAPIPSSFSGEEGSPTLSGSTDPPAATASSWAPRQIPNTGFFCRCQLDSHSSSCRSQCIFGSLRWFTPIGPPSTTAMVSGVLAGSGRSSPRSGRIVWMLMPRCIASSWIRSGPS